MFLGDQVDQKRKEANSFIEQLAQNPSPEMLSTINKLYRTLPSICFILREHAMEKVEALRRNLFDQIPFLSNSSTNRDEIFLPRETPNDAINAALGLCAPDASVNESAVDGITRILGQIATQYSFRHAEDGLSELPVLHETNVVAAVIKRSLEQIAVVCRFANQLKRSTSEVYEEDIKRFQRCVLADLRVKNRKVESVMNDIRSHGHATWPSTNALSDPLSAFAKRLPIDQRAQFLSCPQIRSLISAFRTRESQQSTSIEYALPQQEFLALVLDASQRHGFPGCWQDPSSLAALVLRCSSSLGLVSWRKFILSILCTQFLSFPAAHDITGYAEQALRWIGSTINQESARAEVSLSRQDFLRIPAWFETGDRANRSVVGQVKELLFLLFASSHCHSAEDATVELLPMLLHWCLHPSCDVDVRSDLEHFLPLYSRGLVRVFYLLAPWRPRQSGSADFLDMNKFRQLLEYAHVPIDEQKLDELRQRDGNRIHWKRGDNADITSFLRFCDAYDADLASRFLFVNPFDALLSPRSSF